MKRNSLRQLFRGRRLDDPEIWIQGLLIESEECDEVFIQSCYMGQSSDHSNEPTINAIIYEVDPDTVGQFCCKSKYGDLLFEGDLVKTHTGRICEITYLSSPYHQGFDLRAVDQFVCPPPSKTLLWKDLIVVGNKWNDPFLEESRMQEREIREDECTKTDETAKES